MRYIILLGAVATAVIGYTVFWFMAASGAQDAFEDWASAANGQGFAVKYSGVAVNGYPFRLVTTVKTLDWGFPTADGMVHWQSNDLRVVGEPWESDHLIVLFSGPQEVLVPQPGAAAQHYTITAGRARASLVMPGAGARLSFASENLDIVNVDSNEHVAAGVAQMYLMQVMPSPATTTPAAPGGAGEGKTPSLPATAQLDVRLQNVTLPQGKGGTLGEKIQSFQGEGVVHGLLAGPSAAQMQQWAQAGGTMDVSGLSVNWGDFAMQAAGTLALDEDNRPLGAFEARFQGLNDALNALANLENIPDDTMRLAQSTLKAIENDKDGSWLTVPFTMQNGFLYMGPLPLVKLAPIAQ